MAKLNVEDLTAAIKASAQATAEAAATAAVNAIVTQQNNQVVVHREPNIQPFEASGDNLTQGIELLDYIDQYNWICASAHITEAAELKSTLLARGGKVIRQINNSVRDDEVDGTDEYKKLINKLKVKYITVDQKKAARHQFFSAQQRSGENFIDFYLRLKRLMELCQFENFDQDTKDELLKDILLARTTNDKIRNHCYTNDQNLKQCYTYASTVLNIQAQTKSIKSDHQVNRINSNNNNIRNNNTSGKQCNRCGYDSRHAVCYARSQKCDGCGMVGHYKRMCRQQQPQRQFHQQPQQDRQQQQQHSRPTYRRSQSRGRFQRGQNRFQNNSRFSRQITAESDENGLPFTQQQEDESQLYDETQNDDNYNDDETVEAFSRHIYSSKE